MSSDDDNRHSSGAREQAWKIHGLSLAGLAWGPAEGRPVFALHGWLDHADSLQDLAPRLEGAHVVAVDLPGHGRSAHRSPDATYAIWDDIPQLLALLDELGWDRCTLLGHSRGAIISLIMAAIRPDRFDAVIALDALLPEPVPDDRFVSQMQRFIEDSARLRSRQSRVAPDREAFIRQRVRSGNSRAVAEKLAPRATEATERGFRVRADPRLQAASPIKLNTGQIDRILRSVEPPVLALWPDDGISGRPFLTEMRRKAAELMLDYSEARMPGDHHWHLDPAAAEEIADRIAAFLDAKTKD